MKSKTKIGLVHFVNFGSTICRAMKLIFFAFLFILSSTLVDAQNWLRSDGGQNNDEALSIDHDGSGLIYTAGYFNSACNFENTTLLSSGFSDIFISKRQADATPLWAVKAGGSLPDRSFASKTDESGNTVITGYFTFNAQFGSNINLSANAGSQDAFVAKLDTDGNFLWALPIGGELDDTGYGVDIDINGNIFVTGQFSGTGVFGPYTLESTIDPNTNNPSMDIFLMKLNSNGTVLWVKQGIAEEEDRGLDVSTDSEGNVYMSGQFSGNITFDEYHDNNVDNAGFLAKFDSDGNELWYLKLAGLYVLCSDVEVDHNDDVLLLGDYGGQLALFYTPLQYVDDSHTYNFFIAKFDPTGELTWIEQDGSDNEVSGKALSIEANNSANIAGTFRCVMNEYSDNYGEGLFNSVGFRDVFISKYTANGEWDWARQFGGAKDDQCQAISVFIDDLPVIAGGFDGYFNVPADDTFNENDDENYLISYYGANYSYTYCGDPFYGYFISSLTEGNRDIFITSPYKSSKSPYDFYNRTNSPPCSFNIIDPCIEDCSSTIVACDWTFIGVTTNSGTPGYLGPDLNFEWEIGFDTQSIFINESEVYNVSIERVDGCDSWIESVDVTINNSPPFAAFTDDHGIFIDYHSSYLYYNLCAPDSLTIEVSDIQGVDSYWTYLGEDYSSNEFTITETGEVLFSVLSEEGCLTQTLIQVEINELPELEVIPALSLVDGFTLYDADTVFICLNENVEIALYDSLIGYYTVIHEDAQASWIISPGPLGQTYYYNILHFYPTESGLYNFEALLTIEVSPNCDIIEFEPISIEVYIELLEPPINNPVINGESFFCPGDTSLLTVSGGDNYSWNGPSILEQLAPDSILVVDAGLYSVTSTIMSADSCISNEFVAMFLSENPSPQIFTIPADGLICPEDSILITTNEGVSWQWVSPLGVIVGEENNLYADVPGFYHCIITDEDGCTMESNFVEINQYNSPYLLAYPGVTFCNDEDPIEITIQTNPEANVNWFPPLSGSSTTQVLSEPGDYTVAVSLCGITDTLTITLNPSETAAIIIPEYEGEICPGEEIVLYANPGMESYLWLPSFVSGDSLLVNQGGTYTLTTTDTSGCMGVSSPYIVSIYDIPPPSSEDMTYCLDEEIELFANGFGEIYWYSDSELTDLVNTGSVFNISIPVDSTSYFVIQEDSVCASLTQEINLSLNPNSLPIIADNNSPTCIGDTLILFILGGDENVNYTWTDANGNQYSGDTVEINTASNADAGEWTVFQFDSQCTGPEDTLFVEIIIPEPVLLNIDDITLCFNDSIEINVLDGYENYNWFPNGENTQSIDVNMSGSYWVEVVDEFSCNSISDSINIIIQEGIIAPQIEDVSICYGESTTLSVDSGYYVNWFDENLDFLNDNYSWETPSIIETTTFFVQYFDELSCTSQMQTAVVSLQISGPSVEIVGINEYCVGDILNLSLTQSGPNYFWSTPNGEYYTESITIDNIEIIDAGNYSVQITSPDCQISSEPIEIGVSDYPIIDLSQSGYCLGGSYYFELQSGYDHYIWNGEEGDYFFEVLESDLIEVEVINDPGCSVSDDFYIDPSDCPEIIPNVFTPNNDQWNDFIDFGLFYSQVESIIIFNRWGSEIRTLSGSYIIWDGKMDNGTLANEGVYYYIVNTNANNDSSSGSIQLLR